MTSSPMDPETRLMELLVSQEFGELTTEERDELAALLETQPDIDSTLPIGELIVAMDAADSQDRGSMPDELRARLASQGRALVAGESPAVLPMPRSTGKRSGGWLPLAAAAGLVIATAGTALYLLDQRAQQEQTLRLQIAGLEQQIDSNKTLLANARSTVETLRADIESSDAALREQRLALAEAADREVQLAERLAAATEDLDRANLVIARYEAPADPTVLAANRRKLLEVPGSVRMAWQPFDLPDAPAEQRGEVQGDVVWNDELQTGYLRFVNLEPNDPSKEQYQVWVIDERGLEQKVSGGVFNATEDGEVIVPIEPGIDVGRVALFAITVENPGGTWVPDLSRRVVVAPRDEDG